MMNMRVKEKKTTLCKKDSKTMKRKILVLGSCPTITKMLVWKKNDILFLQNPEEIISASMGDENIVLLRADSEKKAADMMERVRAVMIHAPVIVLTENPMLFKKERTVTPFFDILCLPVAEDLLSRTVHAAFQEIPLMYLRYYQWANMMRLSGQTEEAVRLYEAAMSLNPSFLPPAMDLCWLSCREKDYKKTEAVIRRVPGHDHIPEFLQMRGKMAYLRGELNRAQKYYKKALSLAPFSLKLIMEYGRVLAKSKAYGEIARMILRKAPEFLEMKEKMRKTVRRAVAEGNDRETYTTVRMALRYFPGDREFKDIYKRSAQSLGLSGHEEEEQG